MAEIKILNLNASEINAGLDATVDFIGVHRRTLSTTANIAKCEYCGRTNLIIGKNCPGCGGSTKLINDEPSLTEQMSRFKHILDCHRCP